MNTEPKNTALSKTDDDNVNGTSSNSSQGTSVFGNNNKVDVSNTNKTPKQQMMKPLEVNFFSPTPPKVSARKEVDMSKSKLRSSTTTAETVYDSPTTATMKNDVEIKTENKMVDTTANDSVEDINNTNSSVENNITDTRLESENTKRHMVGDGPTIRSLIENPEEVEQKLSVSPNVFEKKEDKPVDNINMKKVDANEVDSNKDDPVQSVFDQVNSIIENAKQDEAAAVGKDLIDTSSQSDDVTIKSVKSFDFFNNIEDEDDNRNNDIFGKTAPIVNTTNATFPAAKLNENQPLSSASDLFANIDKNGSIDPVADFFQSVDAIEPSIFDNATPQATNNSGHMYSNTNVNKINNTNNVSEQNPVVATATSVSPVANDWIECIDHNSGYPYWYNNKTGESSWEKPVITLHQPPHTQQQVTQQTITPSSIVNKGVRQQNGTPNSNANSGSSSRNAHLYAQRQQQVQLQQQQTLTKPKKSKGKKTQPFGSLRQSFI
jgi:hypothetical protein